MHVTDNSASDYPSSALQWRCVAFSELDTAQLYCILALRQAVFVVEQACIYQDIDGLDSLCMHLCGWRGDTLEAYARCLPPEPGRRESSIGRVVVAPEARGGELGRELVGRAIAVNRDHWQERDILIGAQSHLQAFYRSFGFSVDGEEYIEDGIPHIHMRLEASTWHS